MAKLNAEQYPLLKGKRPVLGERSSSPRTGGQTGSDWPVGEAGQRELLDLLSVVAGAQRRFLMHATGMGPGEVGWHLAVLAESGCVSVSAGEAGLLCLTERGRAVGEAHRRRRFKSAVVVLLSALSQRGVNGKEAEDV